MICSCKRRPCICRRFELQLAREGLGDLDRFDGDDIVVNNRGAGKAHTDERIASRAETEEYREWARDVLRSRLTREERAVWSLHVEGDGHRTIARKLRMAENHARVVVNRVTDRARKGKTGKTGSTQRRVREWIRRSDPAILVQVAALLMGAG
jgi:hypothetical protein